MGVTGVTPHGQPSVKPARPMRGGWAAPAVAGVAAFWLANLAISATPIAADYRRPVTTHGWDGSGTRWGGASSARQV